MKRALHANLRQRLQAATAGRPRRGTLDWMPGADSGDHLKVTRMEKAGGGFRVHCGTTMPGTCPDLSRF